MRKYKFFVDLEKEERWLNEMARNGYVLERKSGMGYRFENSPAERAVIRIDYRMFRNGADFEDYRALFEDSGWTHIAGTRRSGAQYFKKSQAQEDEDIFSDVDSKAARYKRLSEMWGSLAASFIPLCAVLIMLGNIDPLALLTPADLYYTPELWEKSGAAFWRAFLFETPFALFRGAVFLALPLMVILSAFFSARAKRQYRNLRV
ncbi:DUF2812 domain-containing protein [Paenibacillus soyae]|uniref:DUF2812 domain-containing protein n=1 Tax=Paenibacillus soyae TaxID=2969249 RepID=A0A9X2MPJ4_9BACL|nr:DUF2812 domain-containing protein [Paenibacillus soyae]MCR2804075.1 DUF2812 domain-containing protein [Paenibacillus soyae]